MLFRMIRGVLFRQRGKMLLIAFTIALGASLATSMINVMLDVGDKVNEELKAYGSNITVVPQSEAVISKLCNLSAIRLVREKTAGAAAFLSGTTEFAVPLNAFINVDEELKKLEADLKYQEGFLAGVMKKLGNERFVQNAKPEIVALEEKKKADAEQRIHAIKASIDALKKS